jgi:hypothetical protein
MAQKRPLEDELQETNREPIALSALEFILPTIQRLSLEAIFHPKFENENRTSLEIRKTMKQKIVEEKGYLEVSLKHSGTLLLWCGSQRYYSKNSTGNTFTAIGEVLLRQHYARAKGDYKACSDFIQQHRLTLAFECVTSVLGHHGDLPKRDFLILTAVADRVQERFYSTVALLQLAQRFHLPHNDVWVYSTPSAVDQLFHLYDTTRETGLAQDTLTVLNASANEHVSSMYPHVDFQGDILEGIVIRFVASSALDDSPWRDLVSKSQQTLALFPPSTPASFETPQESKVLGMDIRKMHLHCIQQGGYSELTARLGEAVVKVLKECDGSRRFVEKRKRVEWDIPKIARQILSENIDEETKRIATVIQTADQLKARIEYAVFRENEDRWLCMIHIFHDQTFRKYQQKMKSGDMHLYRGFCIELGSDSVMKEMSEDVNRGTNMDVDDAELNENASLMLKMKFLPYMVRTFCCRNGLQIIKNSGPTAFAQYTMKMMNQWGISQDSQLQWHPFFQAWGVYANACLNGPVMDFVDTKLPPMTEEFYLNHLIHFSPFYTAGKFDYTSGNASQNTHSTFRALVVVVALTVEISEKLADFISVQLGGIKWIKNLDEISDQDMIMMKADKGGGLVCSCVLESGLGRLRKYNKKHADSISVVIYGCADESINAIELMEKDRKTLRGQKNACLKLRCKFITEIAECDDLEASEELSSALSELREISNSVPICDTRAGVLVFFPSIPGSGKSTLCNANVIASLKGSCGTLAGRQVLSLVGDVYNKKKPSYWAYIKEARMANSSSIYIADKNAPATAWRAVGEATCKGTSIPVVPDEKALSTTSIAGIRFPDGTIDSSSNHIYPFSLHYLAVCMARVLARPPRSHCGKLDSAVTIACMIVVKFFGFYRHIAADEFVHNIRGKIEAAGALSTGRPIQVPFFEDDLLPDLPEDLKEALIYSIQLQYGYDNKKVVKFKDDDEVLLEAEMKLRTSLDRHSDWLLSLSASTVISQESFITQVTDHAKGLDNDEKDTPLIKIVSLDVPVSKVHEVLKVHSSELMSFLQISHGDCDIHFHGNFPGVEFIPNTHVTLVHLSSMTQSNIQSTYNHLVGKEVEVSVLGLLWNDRVAALAVELPSETIDGSPFPLPLNDFDHISLWCRHGVQPVESKNLPALVSVGGANKVDFKSVTTLRGILSFWSMENTSSKVTTPQT